MEKKASGLFNCKNKKESIEIWEEIDRLLQKENYGKNKINHTIS